MQAAWAPAGPAAAPSRCPSLLGVARPLRRGPRRRAPGAALLLAPPQAGLTADMLQLAGDVTLPMVKIACLCAVGAACARQGVLGPESRRLLSSLAFNVCTPALMLAKLAPVVDVHTALTLWPVGANIIACQLAGLAFGAAHVALLPPPSRLRPAILAATAVGNVGSLPLAMVLSLVRSPHLALGAHGGDAADMAVCYIMLGWFYATLVQMPMGVWLLRGAAPEADAAGAGKGAAAGAPALAAADGRPPQQQAAELQLVWQLQHEEGPLSCPIVPGSGPVLAFASLQDAASPPTSTPPAAPGEQQHSRQAAPPSMLHTLRESLLSPPVLAGLAALCIGSCPPLKAALFSPGGSLSVLAEVLEALGSPLIPLLLLVLGANLSNGAGPAQLPPASLAAVLASRLLLMPLLGCSALLSARAGGLLPLQDPLALVVMLVVWSTPSALLVHTLSCIAQRSEDEVAGLLFYQYAAAALTLPAWAAAYLSLLGCVGGSGDGVGGVGAP